MRVIVIIGLVVFNVFGVFGQNRTPYSKEFQQAYELHPQIPPGILEAMAMYHSRFENLNPTEGCAGIPVGFGIFNLLEDGKGFFRPTAQLVEEHSNIPIYIMKGDVGKQILGLAKTYSSLMNSNDLEDGPIEKQVRVIQTMSQIPEGSAELEFARQSELYDILRYYERISNEKADFESVFEERLLVLKSSKVDLDEVGQLFKASIGGEIGPCFDYASDVYTQTPTCNYNSRPEAVSAVAVHTVQGSYAGAIAWAQNCNANVSYHYVVRSSDGQVTQMLCESDRGWHVGSENDYTVGIEHEGYVTEPSWYTEEMYFASSSLVKDITESGYDINAKRISHFPWAATTHYNVAGIPGNCNRIKGHQHYPNQTHTDPGSNWDWDYYYRLIDPVASESTITDASGTFTDDGGEIAPYSSDVRSLTLFEPTGASQVEMTFTSFDLEPDWDYLYIYDGWSVFDPLIGVYTGMDNPGTVTSSTGSLLVEFRSDCSIGYAGWEANFIGQFPVGDTEQDSQKLLAFPNPTAGLLNLPRVSGLGWSLLDLSGKMLASGSNTRAINLIELGIAPQPLILRMTTSSETTNQKVVFNR